MFAGQRSIDEIVDIWEGRRDGEEEGWKEGHGVWAGSEPCSGSCEGEIQGWSLSSFWLVPELGNTPYKGCSSRVLPTPPWLKPFQCNYKKLEYIETNEDFCYPTLLNQVAAIEFHIIFEGVMSHLKLKYNFKYSIKH